MWPRVLDWIRGDSYIPVCLFGSIAISRVLARMRGGSSIPVCVLDRGRERIPSGRVQEERESHTLALFLEEVQKRRRRKRVDLVWDAFLLLLYPVSLLLLHRRRRLLYRPRSSSISRFLFLFCR